VSRDYGIPTHAEIVAMKDEAVLSLIDMRAQCVALTVGAERMNVGLNTIRDWERKPENAELIAVRKREIRENILLEKGITEPAILASMGGLLKNMMDELGQRSLGEEKTKDLIDGTLKVLSYLATETTKAFSGQSDPKQITNIANIWMTINKQEETETQVAEVVE